MHKQTLGLDSVANARQLGGYVTEDGRRVKNGVLLRSGMLYGLQPQDQKRLLENYGLTRVIDLRTPREAEEKPDPALEGVTQILLPVMEQESASQAAIVDIYQVYGAEPGRAYVEMARAGALDENMYTCFFDIESSMAAYRRFFHCLLAHREGAVLWHCTGGKDRAGLAAVLVLGVLGVEKETILADFALTNQANRKAIAYLTQEALKHTADPEELEMVAALAGVHVPHMEKVFHRAQHESGSLLAFIQQKVGLTDEEVRTLRKKFLE